MNEDQLKIEAADMAAEAEEHPAEMDVVMDMLIEAEEEISGSFTAESFDV